ncbi:hypothetical protein ACTTAI_00710 (plasmid) [Rhodobacter capsulatus]|uniref:hypothetical protein n=1 Tax=Rhodobacter capsulatus TaxID=1061 RepID=UPI004024AE81
MLIDTFGGGADAQDMLAIAAHRIVSPMMLSRGDLSETRETASWYMNLRGRVDRQCRGFRDPEPGALRVSEAERAVAQELFAALPACEAFLSNRTAYVRMDREGLLGKIAEHTPNRGLPPMCSMP